VFTQRLVNKGMLLEAMLSNKAKLRELVASVMQPQNADDKENTAIFVSRIKEKEYSVRRA
jgi:hypothetical protein